MKTINKGFTAFNECFLKLLEIFLREITIANVKFQSDKGSIYHIRGICTNIFLKNSNILLSENNQKISIDARLKLLVVDGSKKLILFDKSRLYRKSDSQLLSYFVERFSQDTTIENLPVEEQIKLVKEIEIFLISSLYYMKKYYSLDDKNFYEHISSLKPMNFSKNSWKILKSISNQVINFL